MWNKSINEFVPAQQQSATSKQSDETVSFWEKRIVDHSPTLLSIASDLRPVLRCHRHAEQTQKIQRSWGSQRMWWPECDWYCSFQTAIMGKQAHIMQGGESIVRSIGEHHRTNNEVLNEISALSRRCQYIVHGLRNQPFFSTWIFTTKASTWKIRASHWSPKKQV